MVIFYSWTGSVYSQPFLLHTGQAYPRFVVYREPGLLIILCSFDRMGSHHWQWLFNRAMTRWFPCCLKTTRRGKFVFLLSTLLHARMTPRRLHCCYRMTTMQTWSPRLVVIFCLLQRTGWMRFISLFVNKWRVTYAGGAGGISVCSWVYCFGFIYSRVVGWTCDLTKQISTATVDCGLPGS